MAFIGIDPGLGGGIALLSDEGAIIDRSPWPTIKLGKGRDTDILALARCVEANPGATYALEDPGKHAPGASGLVSMRDTFSIARTLLVVHRVRHEIVSRPLVWQREFWKKPKMPKGKKFDTKAAALAAARRLWPGEDFLATNRSTKPHDGIIDALLIAEYARRKLSCK
jgi:hypothetical protein